MNDGDTVQSMSPAASFSMFESFTMVMKRLLTENTKRGREGIVCILLTCIRKIFVPTNMNRGDEAKVNIDDHAIG